MAFLAELDLLREKLHVLAPAERSRLVRTHPLTELVKHDHATAVRIHSLKLLRELLVTQVHA
jgi:hypothetical protein